MEKIAKTQYPIMDILAKRWSPRSFNNTKEISQEDINSLFEAARWTASSYNFQPWQFIYGKRGDGTFKKINESLIEFNQLWAPKSSLLFVVLGNELMPDGNYNSAHQYDCGAAVANLTIEATQRGLFVHQMGGFNPEIISKSFDLPENIKPLVVVAVGYDDLPENLHENLIEMEKAERSRKSIDEFVRNK
jgi:nitroreductase